MASLYDQISYVRGVSQRHTDAILGTLQYVGFDIYAKREGAVLRYIDVDALPFLDVWQRGILKGLARRKLHGLTKGSVQPRLSSHDT